MNHSFKSWVRRRSETGDVMPEADKVVLLITSMTGMSRKQIGNAIRLDRDVLDELLDGLVRSGMLSVTWENGVPMFRTNQV